MQLIKVNDLVEKYDITEGIDKEKGYTIINIEKLNEHIYKQRGEQNIVENIYKHLKKKSQIEKKIKLINILNFIGVFK